MIEPLSSIWKHAIYETLRRLFGHCYGCCGKWWKSCGRCEYNK